MVVDSGVGVCVSLHLMLLLLVVLAMHANFCFFCFVVIFWISTTKFTALCSAFSHRLRHRLLLLMLQHQTRFRDFLSSSNTADESHQFQRLLPGQHVGSVPVKFYRTQHYILDRQCTKHLLFCSVCSLFLMLLFFFLLCHCSCVCSGSSTCLFCYSCVIVLLLQSLLLCLCLCLFWF